MPIDRLNLSRTLIPLSIYIFQGLPLTMLINKSYPMTIADLPSLQINYNLKQHNNNNNKLQHNHTPNFPIVMLKLQCNLPYPPLLFLRLHADLLLLSSLPQKTSWTILQTPTLSYREVLLIHYLVP